MLKTDFPIFFDETELTIPHLAWTRGYANSIVINETESGIDDVEYLRFGKTTIRCQFRCMDEWASTIIEFSNHPAISVKFYDVEAKEYVTKSMRMENLSVSERRHTDEVAVTNGIYDISFNLVEF